MGEGGWLVLFLVTQRVAELAFASANTTRLRASGAVEFGRSHYPAMIVLHSAWLLTLWVAGHDRVVSVPWLAVFIVLQMARLWVILALGRRWTTRIIVMAGELAVVRGPYRWVHHPNYLVVALEIAVVPLALGLPAAAAVFSMANAAMLYYRIRVENAALVWAASTTSNLRNPDGALANARARR